MLPRSSGYRLPVEDQRPIGRPDTVSEPPANALDRYFKITERGSTLAREARGGIVTFFTMAYIVVLNPIIIGGIPGEAKNATCSATCCRCRRSRRSRRSSRAS